MINLLKELLLGQDLVIILGFGREGKSTYRLLRKYFPEISIMISDVNLAVNQLEETAADIHLKFSTGVDYQHILGSKAVVFKSPGVKIDANLLHPQSILTSQTNVFIQRYHQQLIGVSGTKGKSTTSSLIFHLLKAGGLDAVLLGNIGIPAFDKLEAVSDKTTIVFELSAHQLQHVKHSPHIAVLLNIFPEHLDYFTSLEAYRDAKLNLYAFQSTEDVLIVPESLLDQVKGGRGEVLSFSQNSDSTTAKLGDQKKFTIAGKQFIFPEIHLKGIHNKLNILAALMAVQQAGIEIPEILQSVSTFRGLPHRLEYVTEKNGVTYYNDSISTIPASAMAAIEALQDVGSLILGGFDRGIDYQELVTYIEKSEIKCVVLLGEAGKRMLSLFTSDFNGQPLIADTLGQAVELATNHTPKGKICLLSPAAASYDQFHNFEHRGDTFKEIVLKIT
ncbi:MAG: UDP-N-acetylmuramoyl-L-alanine--D-glutamate ligase [Bacteroidales bacterium]|nr:UDP-N-acetylmuramoyl-L-alanine--D-glutamate ligase [Bacteroidales bacterium]